MNAVLPGFTVTPMTDVIPEKVKQMVTGMIPLGRMGNPEGISSPSNVTFDKETVQSNSDKKTTLKLICNGLSD